MHNTTDYSFHFETTKTPKNIFETLLDVPSWWSGLFAEIIEGKTSQLEDAFTFQAGGGIHFSKQELIELIPHQKIVWLVTDSNLSFLKEPDEWTGTKFGFTITTRENKTHVCFTHQGLTPKIECYGDCAGAWTQYMKNLEEKLK